MKYRVVETNKNVITKQLKIRKKMKRTKVYIKCPKHDTFVKSLVSQSYNLIRHRLNLMLLKVKAFDQEQNLWL